RRIRRGPGCLPEADPSLHPGALALDHPLGFEGAVFDRRPSARLDRSAAGMPLPSAVPACARNLSDGGATMDPVPRRSLRGLSLREGLSVTDDILEVRDLVKHFPVKSTGLPDFLGGHRLVVHAVDGISFSLRRGEIFGLVGESGCGKTTAGRTVLRLLEPTAGTIRFDGMDITHLKEAKLRPLRK